jgi:hypothetical protein
MTEHDRLNNHEKFKELGALANSGSLTTDGWEELRDHLETCQACSEVYRQYAILARDEMPLLAARHSYQKERETWDDASVRRKVFARVRLKEEQVASEPSDQLKVVYPGSLRPIPANRQTRAVLAACLVAAFGLAAYRLGSRAHTDTQPLQVSSEDHQRNLVTEKNKTVYKSNEMLDSKIKKLSQLDQLASQKEKELTKLRLALRTWEDRASKLAATNSAMNEQLQNVSPERDALRRQLRDAEQAYQDIQIELASLRSERDDALLRSASLESRIAELDTVTRNQERRLTDDEQFLASDRDIRELMGARKLYIADVFDVDSRSRTRKPFGRVFYTQGKSLIFYAFDLDRPSDMKNASSFQAWGRNEIDQEKPLNLGILYMDSESNRRWVLRFDDPKQLAEIDALFVTVEPQGGSQKPTGKPFLYALLRKEVNHP